MPLSALLVVLHFCAGNAGILVFARQRVALLLRDLVVRFHLVLTRVGDGILGLERRLRVGLGLVTGGLGFLHADVLVVTLLAVAYRHCGLVVRIGLGHGRVVLILDRLLGIGRALS